MEVDTGDRFADGDIDGDGYDNDYDYMDILYEAPSNPPAYADDAPAAPIEALKAALSSVPNFTNGGDSFSGDLSASPGLPGVQSVLDVLRTINRVTRASRQQLAPRA